MQWIYNIINYFKEISTKPMITWSVLDYGAILGLTIIGLIGLAILFGLVSLILYFFKYVCVYIVYYKKGYFVLRSYNAWDCTSETYSYNVVKHGQPCEYFESRIGAINYIKSQVLKNKKELKIDENY